MRLLAPLAFAALLQAQEAKNPATSTADVAAGAKTFRSHCSECHGFEAQGGRGPNLASGVFYHGSSDAELLRNISDGIAGTEMPGLFYSPDRVWQVVSYLRSLNARAAPAGDPAKGAAIYGAKGCAKCHRIDGSGGRLGPDLSQIGRARSAEHIRQAIATPNADVRQRYWFVSATGPEGKPVSGFLMNEDTYTVQFMDLGEQLHSMNKSDLRGYQVEMKSRMPPFPMPAADLDNLTAYLVSLRPKGGSK